MKRYDIERAVYRAELPGPSVSILVFLASRVNAATGEIPARAQPSLSQIAAATGFDRSTVKRHLNAREADGWLTRIRPPAWLAQTYHATTAYVIHPPEDYPQARRRGHPRHGAPGPGAGRDPAEALGAQQAAARRAADLEQGAAPAGAGRPAAPSTDSQTETPNDRHRSSTAPGPAAEDPAERAARAAIVRDELRELTGRRITLRDADEIARQITQGRRLRSPGPYIRAALRASPARYLPAGGPPAYEDIARLQAEAIAGTPPERTDT